MNIINKEGKNSSFKQKKILLILHKNEKSRKLWIMHNKKDAQSIAQKWLIRG